MEFALIAIAACLVIGGLAALISFRPDVLNDTPAAPITDQSDHNDYIRMKNVQFSLNNTLLIIGPAPNHSACRMQRKLLKPAIPLLIREDISIIEIYGDASPRKNGEVLSWLDSSLLRHALDTHDGFFVIFVDATGKTRCRKKSPMLADMIADRTGLRIQAPSKLGESVQSDIIRRLQAA